MTLLTPSELAARWAVKRWRVLAIARSGPLPFISRTDDVLERAAAVLEEALA